MQVYCPECSTGYEIDPALIPNEGKKLRCAQCDNIWLCTPSDFIDVDKLHRLIDEGASLPQVETAEVENETANEAEVELRVEPEFDNIEANKDDNSNGMQEIFARLSAQSESIYKAEKEIPAYKKVLKSLIKFFALQNKKVCFIYFIVFVTLIALALNYARYDIVRKFPSLEKVYATFGIESKIIGEGLEFQNVNRRDFEEDFVNMTEVKGYIVNKTDKDIELPIIHLNMLDKDAQVLQEVESKLEDKKVIGGGQVAFKLIVTKPSTLSKYIYLTFVKNNKLTN